MNAAKLKAIAAILTDYTPGDDDSEDADAVALIKAILATKSAND